MSAGLFRIHLGGRGATSAGDAGLPSAARAKPAFRQAKERVLQRYCCGCSRETEHVLCRGGDGSNIPAIRWPAAKPASGTTICVDCGQWRTAASRPSGPAWSSWPRILQEASARLSVSEPESAGPPGDGALETAAENEGMPLLRGPSRLRRRQPAWTMKNAIATY